MISSDTSLYSLVSIIWKNLIPALRKECFFLTISYCKRLACARDYVFYSNRYQCRICYIFYLLLYRSPCHGSKDTRKNCCYKKLSDNMASYVCRNICALLCIQINYNNVVYSCWGPDCCNHNLLLFFSFFNQQTALWRLIALHFLTNIKLIFTLFICTVRWLTFARRSVLMMSSARKDINYEKVRDYYQTWKTWWS